MLLIKTLISKENSVYCLMLPFCKRRFLSRLMAHQEFSTRSTAYHETPLIAINYRLNTHHFSSEGYIYFRGAIIVCTLILLMM